MRMAIAAFLFLCKGIVAFSQISVSGHFESDSAIIGDRVAFILAIKLDSETSIEEIHTSVFDSIFSLLKTREENPGGAGNNTDPVVGDYTIPSYGLWGREAENQSIQVPALKFDTTRVGSNLLLENRIEFTFWDPGPQVLHFPEVGYSRQGQKRLWPSQGSSTIYIKSPFQRSNESIDSIGLAPIKPIMVEKKNITDYYPLLGVLGAALLIGIFWILRKKYQVRKTNGFIQPEIIVPAHQIAQNKLRELSEKKLWQKGFIKPYQSELTFIIREYLENRYGIMALESTTDEILRELKNVSFNKDLENSLKHILQVADMVKFAKATPEISVHEEFLNRAFEFVNSTKKEILSEDQPEQESSE